ncbi:hypothetical protein BU23DRAFT_564150 [Bimuria novae-zelandiae CBS 107.79]|uniref:HRQ family protein 2 n=1 Tax=Bimuria novae-zelandiae CBS 107.79 TaxID=1447943 RepID=A0A6A5VZJ5_9PLEO|nr:hypothetical protein BU23DRAFT_564150 [Bimuria novae-zelandiae CBS 107.79]
MVQLEVIKASWALLFLGIVAFTLQRIAQKTPEKPHTFPPKPRPEYSEDAYYTIEPLSKLDLATEEPIKLRTFKPKYHLTMGLENTTISDLIAMDNTYEQRLKIRYDLLRDAEHEVLAHRPAAAASVQEFYSWMTSTYLPQRFPTIYTLTPTGLYNSVTSLTLPLTPTDASQALSLLGANVDCDFLFMLPIPPGDAAYRSEEGTKYRLEAFINCFPSGFSPREKLGLSLADIHSPVPSYAAKLQKSMDRFFATLPVGRIVKRHNWTVTTHTRLHVLAGNHMSEEEAAEEGVKEEEEVDLGQTVLRCERQTLHRLPGTGALVFAFKTYTYPIRELREEGSGEALAQAVEGMGRGSVPEMRVYKRQVVWGEKVANYLRGDIDE